MRCWVWLLFGLGQASLSVGASFLLPTHRLGRWHYVWETFAGQLGRFASTGAAPQFDQAITCNMDNRRGGYSRGAFNGAVSRRPFCVSFVRAGKFAAVPSSAQPYLQQHEDGRSSASAFSDAAKQSPPTLTSRTKEKPLFVNASQRSSSAQDVERGAQQTPIQSIPTNALLPPRGFRDFPPDVLAIHKHIFSCWHEVAAEFGFLEYKGPSVERFSLYSPFCRSLPPSSRSSPIATSLEGKSVSSAVSLPPHIYMLQGDGPDCLCLRPELTPSLTRMLLREQQQHPSGIARRWYSVERVWRHERPCCGRRREHFQWNLDIALPVLRRRNSFTDPHTAGAAQQANGSPNHQQQHKMGSRTAGFCSFAVAELIAAAVRLFQKLGLSSRDVRIRVGSRSLLRDLLWTEEEMRSTGAGFSTTVRNNQALDNGTPSCTALHSSPTHDACTFQQRLTTAMQVLDRASRRSQEETENALADGLGITVEKSRLILQRLLSFDINNDSVVRELGRKLQRLSEGNGTQHGRDGKLGIMRSQKPSEGGDVLPGPLPTSVSDLQSVVHLLREGYGIGDWVDVDLLIVRGLHYYTGVVFEAFDSEGVFRALLGGGCYGETEYPSAGVSTGTEVPSLCTENPEVQEMDLNTNALSSRSAVTGVGLGMGDCVLMELLQRKGLLPSAVYPVDVIVAICQSPASQHAGEASGVSPFYAPSGDQRLAETDDSSSDELCHSAPSTAGDPDWQSVAAKQLCCKLRALGLRVELLLPPQRSERAAIKHARSVGAKAVIFVTGVQQPLVLEDGTKTPASTAAGPPVPSSEAKQMAVPTEFKVLLIPGDGRKLALAGKQYLTGQKEDSTTLHHPRVSSSERRRALTSIPSVIEMLKAHLCPTSRGKQPSS